MLIELT